jgi:hypothetical protein
MKIEFEITRFNTSTGVDESSFVRLMKRPRKEQLYAVGVSGLSISSRLIPGDGREHKLAAWWNGTTLSVSLDDKLLFAKTRAQLAAEPTKALPAARSRRSKSQ